MKVLIIGDSQAQGAGSVLAATLNATLKAQPGASIDGVINLAKPLVGKNGGKEWDQVIIFAGGNGTVSVESVNKLLSMFPGADWIGPPPATLITDLGKARAVFGGKVDGASYWFKDGTAESREKKNDLLKVAVTEAGGKYHDWRKFGLGGEKQPSGVTFPSQPDGIHIGKATAEQAFANGIPANLRDNFGLFLALGALLLVGFRSWRDRKVKG